MMGGTYDPKQRSVAELCGCMRCFDERVAALPAADRVSRFMMGPGDASFRYACEVCGNKRCPHHTDHRLKCSGSNLPGQTGSAYG